MAKPAPAAKPDKRQRTRAALAALIEREPRFREALDLVGFIPDRRRAATFANLCRIVVQQQVSIASAAAIWHRLEGLVQPFEAGPLLATDEAALLRCGLSRPKLRYLREIAKAVAAGTLDLASLPKLTDAAVAEQLTAVKGIGRWTAEIYLMFMLDRADIWPAHDVALQEAVRRLFHLRQRPNVKQMDRRAEKWRPYRAVAARLLWGYYGVSKQREITPA